MNWAFGKLKIPNATFFSPFRRNYEKK